MAKALYRMTYLENWDSGAKRIMDACQTQGVETPTWSSDGGFVTIMFKRPDFKSDIIENDKEDKKIAEAGEPPPKYPSSRIAHSKNGRFLHDNEGYGGCM